MANLAAPVDRAAPRHPRRPGRRSWRFYLRALAWTPRTLRRYRQEVLRLLAEVSFGTGALAVIGGTVGVISA